MTKTNGLMMTLGAVLVLSVSAYAQTASPPEGPRPATTAVTISVTEGGIRFVGLGSFRQMRLEVFGGDGGSVYNSDFQAGSVRDWGLADKGGQRLVDGTYLCVVTIRDLSGKLVTKQGSVVLQSGQASLQMNDGEAAGSVEAEKALTPVADSANAAVALIGHDGRNGQLVSTRGGFSFRAGDFFGGKDQELMRLTPIDNGRARLDIAGTIRATQGIEFADGTVQTTGLSGRTDAQGNIVPSVTGTGTMNNLAKWTDNSGTLGNSQVTEINGQVGIGVSSPGDLLDISGAPNASSRSGIHVTTPSSTGNATLYFDNNRGNFSAYGGVLTGGSANQNLFFGVTRADKTFLIADGPSSLGLGIGTLVGQPVLFGTGNLERMRITISGNVGIGTNNPQSLLDVAGNLNVSGNATISGNIAAKYQDIAEWTSAREQLAAGTVVSLDALRTNSVIASQRAYDTRVAGVVSTRPGVILGEGGPNKVLVATTGRVKVRVKANGHPIHIGDLLVTSNQPGVAMKSQAVRLHGRPMHRPGTIVGKALEPLLKGEGEILVLLSLQ